ncbi:MAG: Uma2 family endonuclease [Chloroflexota bacterium]
MTIQLQRNRRMPMIDFLVDSPVETNNSLELEFVTKPDPKEDDTIYGWRTVCEMDEDGNEHWIEIPLTLEDYLHPQEGDKFMINSGHDVITGYICSALGTYIGYRTRIVDGVGSVSYGDVGIDWNIPDEAAISPDVSIIHNVRNPLEIRGIFNIAEEGTTPSLVIEVTSPSTRSADFHQKFEKYERREVPYYIIVDTMDKTSFQLVGYEMIGNGYVEMTPNEQGWLWMPPVNAWIGVQGNEVRCYDADGNYLPSHAETTEQLAETSEQLAETSEQLAETSEQLAEERARNEQLANYLRSLGIDPDNLPAGG